MPFLQSNQQRQSTEGTKTVQENADKQTQYKSEKVNSLKYSKINYPGSVPLTTLGQETRWAYSTTPPEETRVE